MLFLNKEIPFFEKNKIGYIFQLILILNFHFVLCNFTNESFNNSSDSNYDYDSNINNYTSEVTTLDLSLEPLNISDAIDTNFTEIDHVVNENWEYSEGQGNKKYLLFTTPDEDICSCDLHANNCDINCCCDPDCSEEDMKVFSECYSQVLTPDKNYCYQTDIIFKNNTIYKMIKDPESSLFCIVHDNLKIHLRYKDIPLIKSHRDLDLILKYQLKDIYSWDSEEKKEISEWGDTRAGNPVYIDYLSHATKKKISTNWRLPSSCISRVCSCNEDILYLEDFKSSCNRIVSNLKLECRPLTVLSADYYSNFCISLRSLSPDIYSNLNDLIAHSKTTYSMHENSTHVCSEKSSLLPTYIKNSCLNVVKGIHFTVIHNGFNGIHSIETAFEYINVTGENPIVVQNFAVTYKWYNFSDSVKRSGNPGYQVGLPILVGTNNSVLETDLFDIEIKPDGLSVLGSISGSLCSQTQRTVVKFGKNLKTSCIFKFSKLDCKRLQERIFDFLLDSSNTQVFIGVFGNANSSNFDDWLEAYHEDNEIVFSDETCYLITSLKINIAYAAVGTVVNPQYKILGVGYHYSKPIAVDLSDTSKLILSTSVSFFDTTEPAITLYPKVPSIKANLPSDFFYPFMYGRGSLFFPNTWFILFINFILTFKMQ